MSPRHMEPTPVPPRVAVAPAAVLALLRAAVGSPFLAPLPDEDAGTMGDPLPDAMAIDAGAWVAWCLAGLHVFERFEAGQEPDVEAPSWLDVIGDVAKRVMAVLVMRRMSGNLSHAALGLRASWRALRERLKAAGLHPWPRAPEPTPRQRLDASGLTRVVAVLGSRPLAFDGSDRDPPAAANGPGTLPEAANGPGAVAIVQALAGILERAEALRMAGYQPLAAIVRAMRERRTDGKLGCVAMAAWALAVGLDDHGAVGT